jgi:hypothetical protein
MYRIVVILGSPSPSMMARLKALDGSQSDEARLGPIQRGRLGPIPEAVLGTSFVVEHPHFRRVCGSRARALLVVMQCHNWSDTNEHPS